MNSQTFKRGTSCCFVIFFFNIYIRKHFEQKNWDHQIGRVNPSSASAVDTKRKGYDSINTSGSVQKGHCESK